jgi:hypothetical protein
MGEFKAGVWFALTTLYFFLFVGIATVATTFGSDVGAEYGSASFSGGDLVSFDSDSGLYCDDPRYGYAPNGDYIRVGVTDYRCSASLGATQEDVCNALLGCTWENVTSGFWFFASTDEGCTGTINASQYSLATANLCTTNITSECQILGCTVYEPQQESDIPKSPLYFLTVTADLFTFQYDFGFNNLTDTFLTFMAVFLPLLLWIYSLYMMLPVIH